MQMAWALELFGLWRLGENVLAESDGCCPKVGGGWDRLILTTEFTEEES